MERRGDAQVGAAGGPPAAVGLDDAPDGLLATRAADGDRRAFTVLVRRYGGLLAGYAARVLGRRAAGDDVVQEAFITAWQQLGTLEDPATVRTWLIRITTRKALDHLRGDRDHDDVDDLDPGDPAGGPEQAAEVASLGRDLARALDRLPAVQRRVWVLKEVGGYRYDEIAAELDLPPSTVRGALARARRTLITDLDGWRQP